MTCANMATYQITEGHIQNVDMKWELPSYQESVTEFKERESNILDILMKEAEAMARS